MATTPETAAFFLEQLAGRGVSLRKMFGEYGVYAEGKMVALLCDDCLFVRPLPEAEALMTAPVLAPPYPGAKPHLRIEADAWEEADWLAELIAVMARCLPAPKPKTKKPRGAAQNTTQG